MRGSGEDEVRGSGLSLGSGKVGMGMGEVRGRVKGKVGDEGQG